MLQIQSHATVEPNQHPPKWSKSNSGHNLQMHCFSICTFMCIHNNQAVQIWIKFITQVFSCKLCKRLINAASVTWDLSFDFLCYITSTYVLALRNFQNVSDWLQKKFAPVQNCQKKIKNINLSQWKRAIGKEHSSFFPFNFWKLKLPFNSALNSTSGNLTYFFKNLDVVTWKAVKPENPA